MPLYNPTTGGGAPALPVWTYGGTVFASMVAGAFTVDNAAPNSVNSMALSITQNGQSIDWSTFFSERFTKGSFVLMTNSDGKTLVYRLTTTPSLNGTGATTRFEFSVSLVAGDATAFSGDYQFQLLAVTTSEDSGWIANADAGDKTKTIPNATALADFVAALDLVASGLGAAFVAVAEKTKALETAGADNLRPNT